MSICFTFSILFCGGGACVPQPPPHSYAPVCVLCLYYNRLMLCVCMFLHGCMCVFFNFIHAVCEIASTSLPSSLYSIHTHHCSQKCSTISNTLCIYAAVNGNLDPTLSKGHQAFGVNSTSNLHLQKIEVGWIFTLFIFGRSESAPYLSVGYGESIPNHANCIRQCVNLRLKT